MIPQYEHKARNMFAAWDKHRLIYPMKYHRHAEICLVLEGSLTLTTKNNCYTLEEGDLYVIFPNVLHAVDLSHVEKQLWMFTPEVVPELSHVLLERKPVCPVLRKEAVSPLVAQLLERCVRLYIKDKTLYRQILLAHSDALLQELLLKLELTERGPHRGLAAQLTGYLMENYQENITLDSAAAALDCSKFHISHMVSELFGCNFRTLVNNYRISAAQEALLNTKKSIWEISYACGFQNQSTFNRAFIKLCGMTPTEYRRLSAKL